MILQRCALHCVASRLRRADQEHRHAGLHFEPGEAPAGRTWRGGIGAALTLPTYSHASASRDVRAVTYSALACRSRDAIVRYCKQIEPAWWGCSAVPAYRCTGLPAIHDTSSLLVACAGSDQHSSGVDEACELKRRARRLWARHAAVAASHRLCSTAACCSDAAPFSRRACCCAHART